MSLSLRLLALLMLAAVTCATRAAEPTIPIIIGSKNFAENNLLAEIAAQLLEERGFAVQRRKALGGTKICYDALTNGGIDLYPEYSGTIAQVILQRPQLSRMSELAAELNLSGIQMLPHLGFNNTYAIAVAPATAAQRKLSKISDLLRHTDLRYGFAHEFLNRPDGWPGVQAHYNLFGEPFGLEHGLAYKAMVDGDIDVTDAYVTDADISRYGLVLLEDDRNYFPAYLAAFIARDDLPPAVVDTLRELSGRFDDARMRKLNLSVSDAGQSIVRVAAEFLQAEGLVAGNTHIDDSIWPRLRRNVLRHLKLTIVALSLALLIGIGAALAVYRHNRIADLSLQTAGLLQTIPSIALLALMIPLLGVGQVPAIVALFLYSLLPIMRSTITALRAIPLGYRTVASAMGMDRSEQLRYVLLPLAMPHVLAGIRTAAVISIGTATLAAFIGAGGLGEPIVTGLALNDSGLILQGAVPAALLAVLTELIFNALERKLVPAHMRAGVVNG